MAETPEVARHPSRGEVSTRLAEQIPAILDLWEERVRLKLPAARDQTPPILRDDIPPFLLSLARSLAPVSGPEEPVTELGACRSHGAQRAWVGDYSLDQVLREYYLLRKTVFEVLEAEAPLALHEREAILDCIEQAMQEAATQFMRTQQQALQEREALLRAVIDHCPLLVALKDRQGRYILVNRLWEAAYDLSAEAVRGRTDGELFAPETAEAYQAHDRRVLETGAPTEFEEEVPHPEAGPRTYLTIRFPVLDAAGTPSVLGSVSAEITERKRLEAELASYAADLAGADRRKDEFLAILAHELRNPLFPMLTATHLLKQRGLDDPGAFRRSVEVVERQIRHMARLVEDLLDISRIARGKVELRRAPVELRALIEVVLASCRPHLEERGHQLSLSLPPDPVWLEVDATRIEQVLVNLLNNAAKYTDPGGEVSLAASVEADQVVVRVRDTGIGIPAGELPYVYDLYRQVDETAQQSRGGLGIGLNLVRRLVELHNGSVEATSPGPGQGSEFTVRLPMLEAASGAEGRDGPTPP